MSATGDPSHHETLYIGDTDLTIADVVRVARLNSQVANLSERAKESVERSAAWVDEVLAAMEDAKVAGEEPPAYYGINTGFGAQAGKAALRSEYETRALSRNLITSHSTGVGSYFDEETVRAAMLLRAHSLARGVSGVSLALIHKLVAMLNRGVYPAVPSKGSLGASGDLAPLSHLALAMTKKPDPGPGDHDWQCDELTGEAFELLEPDDLRREQGRAHFPASHATQDRLTGESKLWKIVPGAKAMERVGGPVELRAKEGLGFNNGATFSAALAALTLHDARNLFEHSVLALAMTLEGMRGFRDPFLPQIHAIRRHPGASSVASDVRRYTYGSRLLDPGDANHAPKRLPPQDPYSLRCAPQVLGSVLETIEFVEGVMNREVNAATDNPLILMDLAGGKRVREGREGKEPDYLVFSGGNFHGEPIAFAMDFLGIAITELGSIAERRVFKMTDYEPHLAKKGVGLNAFLIQEEEGREVSSGFMIAQYTAAALVSECKTLAHPDSVDSIPSSANKEDHVSMSLNAARHAREIVDNVEAVIAIEFLCAAQAIDLQAAKEGATPGMVSQVSPWLGTGTRVIYELVRRVPYLERDRVLYPDIRQLIYMIRNGEMARAVRRALGEANDTPA
jgi:histidine ammonia-lyase